MILIKESKIKEIIRRTLFEVVSKPEIKYRLKEDDGYYEIKAILNGKEIGIIAFQELYDLYSYFEDEFSEDEVNELFSSDSVMNIQHLEVDDSVKNSGIGTILTNKAINYIKKQGYPEIYLNASPMGKAGLNIGNLVNFYKKFGFVEFLNQGHNVLMKKSL